MIDKTSAGAKRASKRIVTTMAQLGKIDPCKQDFDTAAEIIENETGAREIANALGNLLYLAKNESNGAGVWAKYIQMGENALTKYRIPYPSEIEQ